MGVDTRIKSHQLNGDVTNIEPPDGEGWRAVSFIPKPIGSVEDGGKVLVLWVREVARKGAAA